MTREYEVLDGGTPHKSGGHITHSALRSVVAHLGLDEAGMGGTQAV